MKLHKLILHEEFFFEEINVRFLVHRSLIDENTREMILEYMASGKVPLDIYVKTAYDIYCFEPVDCFDNLYMEVNGDYLWFAL